MAAVTTPASHLRRVYKMLGALVPALIVGVPPFFLVREAAYRATLTTLGRDQGIFQYIGWAITQGETDYRDVRDVNGPLVHLVHALFLQLGGRNEQRFHALDLAVTGASFAILGACLPGLWKTRSSRVERWIARAGWAFAAWVALTGQYLLPDRYLPITRSSRQPSSQASTPPHTCVKPRSPTVAAKCCPTARVVDSAGTSSSAAAKPPAASRRASRARPCKRSTGRAARRQRRSRPSSARRDHA